MLGTESVIEVIDIPTRPIAWAGEGCCEKCETPTGEQHVFSILKYLVIFTLHL